MGYIPKRSCVAGAGEGNRTLVISLEGFSSTIELHPQRININNLLHPQLTRLMHLNTMLLYNWWRELDSNQRRRKPTDLQSAPFSRSGISPRTLNCLSEYHFLSIFKTFISHKQKAQFKELGFFKGAWQLPTFTRVIRTIIGVESFHGPVRDGKGWFQLAMVTGRRGWAVKLLQPHLSKQFSG